MWSTILLWFTLLLMAVISFLMGVVLLKHVKLDKFERRLVFSMSLFSMLWGSGYVFMAISSTDTGAAIGRGVSIFGEYAFLMASLWFFEFYCKCFNSKKCVLLVTDTVFAFVCAVLSVLAETVTFVPTKFGMSFYTHDGYVRFLKLTFILMNTIIVYIVFHKGLKNLRYKRQRQINRSFAFMGIIILVSAILDEVISDENRLFMPVSCIGIFLFMYMLHVMGFKRNAFSITVGSVSKYTIECVKMPILVLDDMGYVIMANSYAKEFFGDVQEKQNIRLNDLFMISAADADLYLENIVSGMQSGSSRFIAKNNSAVCEVTPNVIMDKFDEQICTIIFVTDMTKEYKLVEQLRNTKTALELELKEKNKQVEIMASQTVAAVASFIDAKEPYTVGHSSRVASYAKNIAIELGWNEAEVRNIYYVGLLHDIGKIGIPHDILAKPSKLTDEEYETIKTHPAIGGEILKGIKSIENVSIGALYHHERYDGKGYPNGVKGEDIPLIARIIGIADAYDAMTSNRNYRKHLEKDVVRSEIKNGAGTQFDPYIASVVVRMIDDGKMSEDIDAEPDIIDEDILIEANQLMARLFDNDPVLEESKGQDRLTRLDTKEIGKRKMSEYLRIGDGAFILIKIDNFEQIKENYGKKIGDIVLCETADILRAFEQTDYVCRFDTDEFVLFLKEAGLVRNIGLTLESILYTYNSRIEESAVLSHTSLSMGVSVSKDDGKDIMELYRCADKALYHLKQNNKSGYCFYNGEIASVNSDTGVDLSLPRIVNILNRRELIPGAYKVEFRQFMRVHDFIEKYAKRNKQQIQLILLTVDYNNLWDDSESNKNEIISEIENAVIYSLRGVDVCTKFSNSQILITLVDTSEENVDLVMNRVLKNFYDSYEDRKIQIDYETQNISIQAS